MAAKKTSFGQLAILVGLVWAGWEALKPSNENPAVGSGKRLTYEILTELPFSTYGFREAEVLRNFKKIKKVQNGVWEISDERGNYFQITYGHPHTKDFTVVG